MNWKNKKDFEIPARRVAPGASGEGLPVRSQSINLKRSTSNLSIPARKASVNMSTFDYNLSKAISLIDSPSLAIQKYNISLQAAISDKDIIGQAIVHSNLGQLYRNLGKLKNAKWHLDRAWFLLTQYIKIAAAAGGSNWLQLAIKATGLEGEFVESAFITHSSEPNRTKISDGPPIVIFTLQLFTNIGNLCFSRGKFDSAIKCHGICKRLVESVFEEYQPPLTILKYSLEANSGRKIQDQKKTKKSSSKKEQYILSYVHKHAILSQASTLNNLGACYGELGFAKQSLQYYLTAEYLLRKVSEHVPGFIASKGALRTSSSVDQFNINFIKHQAAIFSNVGLGWGMAGDHLRETQYSKKGAEYFEKHGSFVNANQKRKLLIGEIRQLSIKAAQKADIGRLVFQGQWLDFMKNSNSLDKISSEKRERFWPSESYNLKIGNNWLRGEKIMDSALGLIYQQLYRQWIYRDWPGIFINYINLELNKPEAALHYLENCVNGHDGKDEDRMDDLDSKPVLPPVLYPAVLVLIFKTLCSVYQKNIKMKAVIGLQQFFFQNLPDASFDFRSPTRNQLLELGDRLEEMLRIFLSETSKQKNILKYQAISFPIPVFGIKKPIENQISKILEHKMRFEITTRNQVKILTENKNRFLNDYVNRIEQIFNGYGLCFIMLSKFADHVENRDELFESNLGMKDFALLADIISYSYKYPDLFLDKCFGFKKDNELLVREGLLEAAGFLFKEKLGICDDCFHKERQFEPCLHGYTYI